MLRNRIESLLFQMIVFGLVLHFRTPEKTLDCLRSMHLEGINQAILIDNSEDDGKSVENLKADFFELEKKGFFVQILTQGKNLGFSAAVNLGIRYISEKNSSASVLLINSDARLNSGSLQKMIEDLKKEKIVAPLIVNSNKKFSSGFGSYDKLTGLMGGKAIFMPLRYASGCCLLIDFELIKSKLFDEDFFFYGEDVMLSFMLEKKGIKIKECLEAFVFHDISASAKNGSFFYEYHMNRCHWMAAIKLADSPLEKKMFLLARIFILPLRALVRSVRLKSLNPLKGFMIASLDLARGKYRSCTPSI